MTETFSQLSESEEKWLRSFKDLAREGLVPCALGPIYEYAGISDDLLERYLQEKPVKAPKEIRGGLIQLEKPLLYRCGVHGHFLTVIDSESYLYFEDWLLSIQFVDRKQQRFFVPRHFTVPVKDPIARETGFLENTSLNVFTLSGLRGLFKPINVQQVKALYTGSIEPNQLQPKDDVIKSVQGAVLHYVDFRLEPPEEGVIVMGKAALEIINNV
jgi:hypothetical protein